MKIKSATLKNFAKFAQISVSFDENITYLVGYNGAGKSTLGLNAIWFVLQGIAEKSAGGTTPLLGERFRFIGVNSASATGELVLYDENTKQEIKVIRKMTKDGSQISFEGPEGAALDQRWLNSLFNIFMIAPQAFLALTGKEQAKVLGIDTTELDKKLLILKGDATLIGRELKAFGELTEVPFAEEVDVAKLNQEKNDILAFNENQKPLQTAIDTANTSLTALKDRKAAIEAELAQININIPKWETFIEKLPKPESLKSTVEIDEKINTASEANKKYLEYQSYLTKKTNKDGVEQELKENKEAQVKVEADRIELLRSKKLPFNELSINEDGELLLGGKPIREPYFSTGELLTIVPVLISSLNPDLKYVFIKDFNLLDPRNQQAVEDYLTQRGFQLVLELVGEKEVVGKHCILLNEINPSV